MWPRSSRMQDGIEEKGIKIKKEVGRKAGAWSCSPGCGWWVWEKENGGPVWKQIHLPDYIDLPPTQHTLLHPLPLTHTHTYVHAYKHGLYELYTTYMRKPHPARPRDSKSHQGKRLLDAEQTIRKHRSPVRVGGFQCLSCMSPSTRSCLSRPASGRP